MSNSNKCIEYKDNITYKIVISKNNKIYKYLKYFVLIGDHNNKPIFISKL